MKYPENLHPYPSIHVPNYQAPAAYPLVSYSYSPYLGKKDHSLTRNMVGYGANPYTTVVEPQVADPRPDPTWKLMKNLNRRISHLESKGSANTAPATQGGGFHFLGGLVVGVGLTALFTRLTR